MSVEPTTMEQPQAPVAAEEHTPVQDATMPTETGPEEPSSTMKPSEAESTIVGGEPTPVPGAKETTLNNNKSEAAIEATPANEGVLGYKGPGLLSKLRYTEHFFWLSGEPVSLEALTNYVGSKDKTAHANAAWATQSGKGLIFYAKRQEDKSVPHGIINLSEATPVTKEGYDVFYFKTHGSKHEFKATSLAQRDSWVVAIEKQIEQATGMKDEITNSAGYKSHIDQLSKAPAVGAATTTTATQNKSATRDPSQATDATSKDKHTGEEVAAAGTGAAAVGGVAAHEKKDEDKTTKSRSQSRKRNSVFSNLLGKKDKDPEQKELKKEEKSEDKAEKKLETDAAKEQKHEQKAVDKEVKQEEKVEKKQEKEAVKEEKKEEKAEKKEIKQEQKEEKQEQKAEKKEEKAEEKEAAKEEKKQNEELHKAEVAGTAAASAAIAADDKNRHEATNDTAKKGKRGSVFGSIFGKKSPTAEKSESEAGPSVPAKDNGDLPPVSATAPKIEEPAATQPIDAAAVTAPVDTVQTPRAEEPKKELGTTETGTSPTHKKEKSGLMGTIMSKLEGKKDQKPEQKAEQKEEKAPINTTKDPVAASSETPAKTSGSAVAANSETDARPSPREGRRSSLFGSLGTTKRKNNATSDTEAANVDTKREKSPVATKIGGLFRRPSKAVKPTASDAPATETAPAPIAKDEPSMTTSDALTNGTSRTETPAMAKGEQSTEAPSSTVHGSVTQAPEIQASA